MLKIFKFLGCFLVLFYLNCSVGFALEPFSLERSIRSLKDTEIATYITPHRTEPSYGIFVYSHGMTSRVKYHEKLLKAVYESGFDVIAYDLPGHGDSERAHGLRGGVRNFDQLVNVLDGVVEESQKIFGKNQVFLSGWSLGGLVTTVYLQENPDKAAAAVLYAPGVSLALADGDFSVFQGVKTNYLVHDKNMAKTLKEDESFFRFPPPCLAVALLKGVARVDSKKYKTKTLLLTAGNDYFVSSSRAEKFYLDARDYSHSDLFITRYANSYHDLENDVDSDSVIQETIEFLSRSFSLDQF